MIIREASESDAAAMGQLMVETYLTAHRGQLPPEAWNKRAAEWTPEVSARAWARTLRELTTGTQPHECVYVAVDGDELLGLAMGSLAGADELPRIGVVDALYVQLHRQGRGVGRALVQAVAADLARHGMAALQIGCLASNAPARGFYEAIGGRLAGERMFDEEGVPVPEVVYEWVDICSLAALQRPAHGSDSGSYERGHLEG